jgi:hypothetical protein
MALSEHTVTTESDHEHDKRVIAQRLMHDHRGKDNRISSTDLAEYTRCEASTVRDLIKEVRREYRLPIGSANGYFIIEHKDEFVRQVERQRQQAETSLQTARDIAAGWNGSQR